MPLQFKLNPLCMVDSYKLSHRKMYPVGTEQVYSNFTPRFDRHFDAPEQFYDHKVVFFGLQGLLKHMDALWDEEFFKKDIDEVCDEYVRRITPYCGGLKVTDEHIRELHAYGRLPIAVCALPEGSRVNLKVPVLVVWNTHKSFFWITNYLETWLSNELWKPCTTATIAKVYRNILEHYARLTGSPLEFVNWQGHDFSCRGMSGMMDAAVSGAGHLTSFTGSDTLVAVDYIEYAYNGKACFVAGSVPASEHSVMTMDGEDGEFELFDRLITEIDTGVVSLVADGYDYWNVLIDYLPRLKDKILARKPDALGLAKVVIRPDSGDPVKIITGYTADEWIMRDGQYYVPSEGRYIMEAERKGSIEVLWEIFGGTYTDKGYRVLDSHIGLIYGDSITMNRADEIMMRLKNKGFASCNVVLGIGSYTYQYITRDTFGFAMKATFGVVNGQFREIYKQPKTDMASKASARGLLKVVKEGDNFVLVDRCTKEQIAEEDNELKAVYVEGFFLNDHTTIDDIRRVVNPDWSM